MKNGKTLAALVLALLFAAVTYAAGQHPVSVSECLTKEQVLESHARSRQGISLSCNETLRQGSAQQNVQQNVQRVDAQRTGG